MSGNRERTSWKGGQGLGGGPGVGKLLKLQGSSYSVSDGGVNV